MQQIERAAARAPDLVSGPHDLAKYIAAFIAESGVVLAKRSPAYTAAVYRALALRDGNPIAAIRKAAIDRLSDVAGI